MSLSPDLDVNCWHRPACGRCIGCRCSAFFTLDFHLVRGQCRRRRVEGNNPPGKSQYRNWLRSYFVGTKSDVMEVVMFPAFAPLCTAPTWAHSGIRSEIVCQGSSAVRARSSTNLNGRTLKSPHIGGRFMSARGNACFMLPGIIALSPLLLCVSLFAQDGPT